MEATFMREDAARSERWAHLTDGVKDAHQKRVLETLLDVQKRLVVDKAPKFEATDTSDVAVWTRNSLGLIRRIFPALVANQISSIQPISQPTARAFYQDFTYKSALAPTAIGDRMDYEANKRNKFFASGVIKGEVVGTGNASATNFNLSLYPIRTSSLTVRVASVVVTNYTIDASTGAIVFAAAPANAASITADYALNMEALGTAGNAKIPEVGMTMTSTNVDLESKKIKSSWTVEAQQDLESVFGQDLEALMTDQMGMEIKREIDRMIIDDMLAGATGGNTNWSKTVPSGWTQKEWYETLVHAMNDSSNEIYKKRLRHASFAITHPDNINLLEKTNSFRLTSGNTADGAPGTANISSGPNLFGTVSQRYQVIVDPLFPTDKILLGYKGDTFDETGYIYMPYVSFNTQTFTDPNTQVPVKSLMHRFGRFMVNGDFYATVSISA